MPLFLWLFLAAGILFLLQLFPLTGIFLMLLAAPLVTGLLFAAALVLLGVEAWRGKLPRIFAAVPVLVLVGYWGYVGYQRLQLAGINAELAAGNRPAVTFDPARDAVVVDSRGLPDRTLVSHYELPSIDHNMSIKVMRVSPTATGDCPPPQRYVRGRRSPLIGAWSTADVCYWDDPPPLTDPLRLVTTEKRDASRGFDLVIETTTLLRGDAVRGSYPTRRTRVLGWLPLPVIGCGLNSSPFSGGWQCAFSTFPPETVRLAATPPGYDNYLPTAVLLNLKRRSASEFDGFVPPRQE